MRKVKKRGIAFLLLAVCLSGSITGCKSNKNNGGSVTKAPTGQGQGGAETTPSVKDVKLTVWTPAEDQAASESVPNGLLTKWCTEFQKEHPEWNIMFSFGVCSEGDARDVVLKDLDAAADVYMFANDQMATLAKAGALAEFGGSTAEKIKNDNSETMYQSVLFNGGVYGIPYTPNTVFLYYNNDLLTEEDVTSLNRMLEKDLPKGVAAFGMETTNSWYLEQFYYAGGFSLFGADGTEADKGTDIGSFSFVTDFLVDLMKNPRFHKESGDDSIARLENGTLASLVTGSWKASAIRDALGEKFATAQLPTVTFENGVTGTMKHFTGSKAVGVNPRSKNMAAAIAFAQYLGSETVQRDRFLYRNITPVNVNLAASEEVQNSEIARAENAVVQNTSVVQPMVDEINNWFTIAETFAEEIYNGSITRQNSEQKTKALEEAINQGNGLGGNTAE